MIMVKKIKYKIKFIDSFTFKSSSQSSDELQNDECISCKSCLKCVSTKDNQIMLKCIKCNKCYE